MKIVIFGGAGTVGSQVAADLIKTSRTVSEIILADRDFGKAV